MNEKILNNRELAQVKRIAQNVDADYQKVCKLNEKIAELTKERNSLQQGIDEQEAPVIRKTGGFKSTDIFAKTIVPQFNENGTPKTDKDGRQIKVTKYVMRYPDTTIPVAPVSEEGQSEVTTPTEPENVVSEPSL
jgi:hypothetical protein